MVEPAPDKKTIKSTKKKIDKQGKSSTKEYKSKLSKFVLSNIFQFLDIKTALKLRRVS